MSGFAPAHAGAGPCPAGRATSSCLLHAPFCVPAHVCTLAKQELPSASTRLNVGARCFGLHAVKSTPSGDDKSGSRQQRSELGRTFVSHVAVLSSVFTTVRLLVNVSRLKKLTLLFGLVQRALLAQLQRIGIIGTTGVSLFGSVHCAKLEATQAVGAGAPAAVTRVVETDAHAHAHADSLKPALMQKRDLQDTLMLAVSVATGTTLVAHCRSAHLHAKERAERRRTKPSYQTVYKQPQGAFQE